MILSDLNVMTFDDLTECMTQSDNLPEIYSTLLNCIFLYVNDFHYLLQVSGLVKGVELDMVAGQDPVTLVSTNIQLAVSSTLASSTADMSLTVPSTAAQAAYGSIQPMITLGPTGLTGCSFTGGYAQMSVLQWAKNPYPDSTDVKGQMLRVSSSGESIATSSLAMSIRSQTHSQTHKNFTKFKLPDVPVYTIALQFSSFQNFDFRFGAEGDVEYSSGTNFTFPVCKMYNGMEYVSCQGCNISSYTNYNVTYACFDITQLCPVASADEDHESIVTYGAIFESLAEEFTTVLSINPFSLDPETSKVVLIFIGSLGGCVILLLSYLLRLDYHEKMQERYIKSDSDAIARRKLEDDILKGGKGDLGHTYRQHVNELNTGSFFSDKMANGFMKSTKNYFSSLASTIPESYQSSNKSTIERMGEISSYQDLPPSTDSDASIERDIIITDEEEEYNRQETRIAIVTGFLNKLFPGRTIFSSKTNFIGMIFENHQYFKMFGGCSVKKSRTIRFLEVVTLVLTSLFADTLFFGIYYPRESSCISLTTQVRKFSFLIMKMIISVRSEITVFYLS